MPTILVVDDDLSVCKALSRTLRLAGYATVMAPGGQEAWNFLKRSGEIIDAVVADITMPGMRGTQLAALLRETRPTLPVVLVTAHSFNERRARERQASPIPLLTKPFDPDH